MLTLSQVNKLRERRAYADHLQLRDLCRERTRLGYGITTRTPLDALIEKESVARIDAAIKSLDARDRAIIDYLIEGVSQVSIARSLGVCRDTVAVSIRASRAAILDAIGD